MHSEKHLQDKPILLYSSWNGLLTTPQFFAKDTLLVGLGEYTATENKWKHHVLPDHTQNHSYK